MTQGFADALKVVAVRQHFATDLDFALGLLGCTRTDVLSIVPARAPEGDEDSEGQIGRDELFDLDGDEPVWVSRADGWTVIPDDAIIGAGEEPVSSSASSSSAPGAGTLVTRSKAPRGRATVAFLLVPDAAEDDPQPYRSVPLPRQMTFVTGHQRPAAVGLDTRTAAPTITSLLRRLSPGPKVDVEALVERIARAEPIEHAPRRLRRRVSGPVGLLYDAKLLVGPYAQDVRDLCELVASLVSGDSLSPGAFHGDPMDGCGSGPIWTWRPFRPPPHASTLLFVTGTYGEDDRSRAQRMRLLLLELQRKGHNARVIWLGAANPPSRDVREFWHRVAR